jgi:hypothetical protein
MRACWSETASGEKALLIAQRKPIAEVAAGMACASGERPSHRVQARRFRGMAGFSGRKGWFR